MEQAIEERGHRGRVAEELPPVINRTVRREQGGRPLVAAHDDLKQVFGGGVRELPHAEVINDEQGNAGELGKELLAGAVEGRVGQLLEEEVRLAVKDAVSL